MDRFGLPRFALIILISVLAGSARAETPSLAKCERKENLPDSNPAWRQETQRIAECVKRAMNAELDLRLLDLKKREPAQFKKEMDLQSTFNKAAQNFNDAMMQKCQGRECQVLCDFKTSFNEYRFKQAHELNSKSLSVAPAKADPKVRKEVDKYFKNFASELCKMPKEVWRAQSVPPDCPKHVLDGLAEKVNYAVQEGDSCSVLAD